MVLAARWLGAFAALASIILVYRRWLHVNPTTVALTLVLFVLLLAARLGLRYAVAVSVAAAACYNFYFLPPVGTFVISDPQNWLALFTFLATGIIGSRLSQKARDEADSALLKQRELEVLFTLSRDLLQTDNVAELVSTLPVITSAVTKAETSTLYLLDGDRIYQSGLRHVTRVELPHLRQLALTLPVAEFSPGEEINIPLRAGVRPRGLLRLTHVSLSTDTAQAIGGLASIALDRAQALEEVARSEANKEGERLRTLILDSITHELKTPLTSIKGATETLLTTEAMDGENRRELLTIIDEETTRLNLLISQAVEMAQIESQEIHMNFAAVALVDVIAEAQESCASGSSTHPVSIQVKPSLRVSADREMMAKVFCNLLENAAKYSAAGSPIFITAEERNGMVTTNVADRGIGIDASEQELIFDRLYRSKLQNRQVSGTGMGLAISRAIVEAHGGTLRVTSQVGHGSVFTFSLASAVAVNALQR